jgi:putative SOS response-associated peptidase YedK
MSVGLWDVWKGGEKPLETCCLITTDANEILASFHDRMPVIIRPADYTRWLDPETPVDELKSLLKPYPAEEMELVQVSKLVNSPKNDVVECMLPAA